MRIDVRFERPLDEQGRLDFVLAIAALAKSERVRVDRSGYAAVIMGEAMGVDRVRRALDEAGVAIRSLSTSLHEEEDAATEDIIGSGGRERFRPIGR
jgi:hypothetical protein